MIVCTPMGSMIETMVGPHHYRHRTHHMHIIIIIGFLNARSIGKTVISPATVANNAIVMKGEELDTSPLLKKVSYLAC